MKNMEMYCFSMISFAGKAKSLCFEAMEAARASLLDQATAKLKEAERIFIEAHQLHAQLIQKESNHEKIEFSLLLIHAEDQLMNAELSKDFAMELIKIHEEIKLLKNK